ncbi:MAG: hypothetical protein U1E49_12075 [Hyphomicrobiaceae bacterium]
MSVDLPAPFAPISATAVPGEKSAVIPFSTERSPNDFDKSATEMADALVRAPTISESFGANIPGVNRSSGNVSTRP